MKIKRLKQKQRPCKETQTEIKTLFSYKMRATRSQSDVPQMDSGSLTQCVLMLPAIKLNGGMSHPAKWPR